MLPFMHGTGRGAQQNKIVVHLAERHVALRKKPFMEKKREGKLWGKNKNQQRKQYFFLPRLSRLDTRDNKEVKEHVTSLSPFPLPLFVIWL
jgi:hypothetical protein